MKVSSLFYFILITLLLTSCSETDELKILGTTSGDVKATFAIKDWRYTIDKAVIKEEEVGQKLGEIKAIVDEIDENGEAVILDSSLNLKPGDTIYTINGMKNEDLVAIKVNNQYHGGVLHSKLE